MKGFEGGVNAMLKEQKNARNFLHRELWAHVCYCLILKCAI